MYLRDEYTSYLKKLEQKNLYRECASSDTTLCLLDFATTDYLNLSTDQRVIEFASQALKEHGASARGSRLLSGNLDIFKELEAEIAKCKHTENALLLNSGFTANMTVIAALLNSDVFTHPPVVFADKLIHTSMILGVQLAKAKLVRYKHLDMNHLEQELQKCKDLPNPKFILSETLFSVDGDFVDLEAITNLAQKYNAFLYLDEAHEIGVFGKNGYGMSVKYADKIGIVMGSFSKGLGSFGGYVACSSNLKKYLVNKCLGFMYSNSLPPSVIASSYKAWTLLPSLGEARTHIKNLSNILMRKLKENHFNIGNACSNIIPIIVGSESKTIALRQYLAKNGILVAALRPPSVAPNTSRLRITINAMHTEADIDHLLKSLCQYSNNQS